MDDEYNAGYKAGTNDGYQQGLHDGSPPSEHSAIVAAANAWGAAQRAHDVDALSHGFASVSMAAAKREATVALYALVDPGEG